MPIKQDEEEPGPWKKFLQGSASPDYPHSQAEEEKDCKYCGGHCWLEKPSGVWICGRCKRRQD